MKSTDNSRVYSGANSACGTATHASFGEMADTERKDVIMVNKTVAWVSRPKI
jgi:hypothetical protein